MLCLKQNTSVIVPFGPFVDKADAVTFKTGLISALDHASTGIVLSKGGGAFAVRHATVTATTYGIYGQYLVTLDSTDTSALGHLRMTWGDPTQVLAVWSDFMVLAPVAWNAFFATSGGFLPNAVADAAGGVLVTTNGSLDVDTALGKLFDGGFTAATYATDLDHYAIAPWLQRRSTGTPTDPYRGVWRKNGVDVTSGITNPKIHVIDATTGADLIAETAMTPVATYLMTYDAVGAELMVAGHPVLIIFKADIDGLTRTSRWIQGRDV